MDDHSDNQKDKKPHMSFADLAAEQKAGAQTRSAEPKLQLSNINNTVGSGPGDREPYGNNTERLSETIYDRAVAFVNQAYDAARAGHRFEIDEGIEIIHQIAGLISEPDFIFIMALHKDYGSRYIYHHPVNVAILAVRLGTSLGLGEEDLSELGLAALLHDIGSVRISESILNKASTLSKPEMDSIKQRPNYSYEILQIFKKEHPYLSETAVQVYERIDGSGYPMGLQKDEINEYAQIIGLVDVYEALIHNRPQRNQFLPFPAVKSIVRECKNSFNRNCLKALINSFSIFPIYSYVRLNSGAIGRVIQTHSDHPMRPKVQVIYDSQERRVLTDRIIDLPENPLLYITDSVGVSEIQDISKH